MTSDSTNQATETTETTETTDGFESITISVEDGPLTPDHDGRSRGWRAELHLDPKAREVSLYTCIGSGAPADVWHNRALAISVDEAAAGERVRELLESERAQELLAEICDSYEGTTWDGHNRVGLWAHDDDNMPVYAPLVEELEKMLADVPAYWSAGAWMSGDWQGCKNEVEEIVFSATSDEAEEKAIDAYVAKMVDDGARDGILLDESDVARVVKELLEEIDGDDDAETIYVVEGPSKPGAPADVVELDADRCDVDACVDDVANVGETWWVVEAKSAAKAWRAARAMRTQGVTASRDELRRLDTVWNSERLAKIVAALT